MEQQLQKLTQAILARGKLLKQLEVQCAAIQASVEEMKPKPVTPPTQTSSLTPPAQASSSRSLATGELDAPMLTGCSMNCPNDDTDSRTSAFTPDAAPGPPSTTALLDAAITNPEPTDATILVRDGTSDLTPTPSGTAVHPIYLGDEHVPNPSNCQLGVRKVFDRMCGTDGVSYGFSTNGLVLTTCCPDESFTADIAVVDRANRRRERAHRVLILARLENSCGAMELRQPWPPPTQVDVACSGVELCPISWLSCEDYRGGVKWMPPWSPPVPGRMLILEKGFCPAINSTEVMCSFLPFDHVRMVSEGYEMCDEVILRAQTRGVLNIFYGCDSDVNILEGNRSSSEQSLCISWSLCDFRGFSEFGKWVMVGLVSSEQGVEAMGPFHLVISSGIGFEVVSLSRFFIACAEVKGYFQGLQVHCLTIKSGFPVDICVKNAILDRYRKYKALAEGYLIFQDMERIDAVSWNAIIAGFSMGKLSEFALKQARPQMELFCKTLTASDTNTHGGFSVPRRSAEKILPSLDFSMQPTAQELQARDIHDNVWTFRHIYRGVDCKTKASDNKPRALSKIASLQQFIPHDYDASDHGTASFPVSAVHRIGILDIRIFNTDRHAGNLLVRKLDTGPARFDAQTELIPINHGLCLPESLEDPYFEWIHWPQASIPFNEEEIEYIANLDPIKDVEMLRMELPMIHEASLRVLVLSTTFLKEAAAYGLCLSEIGEMMSRQFTGKEEEPSELEVLCMEARKWVEERELLLPEANFEEDDDDDKSTQFDLDSEDDSAASEAAKVSILIELFKLLMTGVAVFKVDDLGRRPLLIGGVGGIASSMFLLAAYNKILILQQKRGGLLTSTLGKCSLLCAYKLRLKLTVCVHGDFRGQGTHF